jgi:hypothetical protein
MIEPYQAIGLVPTMRGIRRRDEIGVNLEHISHLIKAASWLSSLDLPVRLIAIPEGALQGFNDEVLDLDHETFARECAIDVPGPETDYLGKLARQWDVPIDTFGGGSAVIDYRGQIVGRHDYSAGSSWVAGTIDVEALRKFRASAQWDNWLKDLTTEQYQVIYEQPVYPKNLYLDRPPYNHGDYRREVIDRQVRLMHDRDIWARPDTGAGGDG